MDMRLLVIEGAFHLRGRDLLLWPPRAIRRAPTPPQISFRRTVTLRQPGGASVSIKVIFTFRNVHAD